MNRVIKNPHYLNNAKTMMGCEFHYDDGRVLTANVTNVNGTNPDWKEIHENFSPDELEANTRRAIQRINGQKDKERIAREAQADKQRNEALYALKLEAFEVSFVKESTNRRLKAQIRKAKTPMEVQAFTAAVILEEFQKSQQLAGQ